MSKKDNLIIDFDNTLADSSRTAIQHTWDKYPEAYEGSVYRDYDLLWNFDPFVKEEHKEETLAYMSTEDFFKNLPVAHADGEDSTAAWNNLRECLKRLSKRYNLVLCTNRDGHSFEYVKEWLKEKRLFEFFSNLICVSNFDKSIIEGSVIIDDKVECLLEGTRALRIPFGGYRYTKDDIYDNLRRLTRNNRNVTSYKSWTNFLKKINPDGEITSWEE